MGISPEQWDRVKDLYEAALECDPTQRADFLRRNSADEIVRKEVQRLLAEHDDVGSFLSTLPFVDRWLPAIQPEKRFAPEEVLAERFRIVGFIAAGGMGEVYEAEDLVLKETLAIKTIRPEVLQQDNALARFKREVHLARKVTHPNICRVFDIFWHKKAGGEGQSDIVFVSMELLRGETLSERIRRAGRFTAEDALPLINQIATGLEAAHRAGVAHRDLKPGNVILVRDRDPNQVRCVITDFGLALRTGVDANISVDLTAMQGVFGTPAYMAPEQIEGKEVTKLADIYALGLIIYEMVTGEHAFPADTPLASAAKRLSDQTLSAKRIVPQLSNVWEQTIIRCLQRNPNARYSSALDVARALSGQKSNSSRRTLALGLGALVFVCIILGTSFYGVRKRSAARLSVPQPIQKAGSVDPKAADITSLVIEKNGAVEPSEEGFKLHSIGRFETGAMRNALNHGYDRWTISTGDQGYYYRTLTDAEKSFASSHDWKLTCVCAVKEGLVHTNIDFGKRFDIELLQEGDKYYVALTKTISPEMQWEHKVEFPGAGDIENLHAYELRYDHSTQTANLWIDNRLIATGYRGHGQFVEDRGLFFGTSTYLSAKTGIAVFRSVRFEAH